MSEARKDLDRWATGDPKAPLRLIPRSGSNPDLRDELRERAEEEIVRYDRLIVEINGQIDDCQDERAKHELNQKRDRLVDNYHAAIRDWQISMEAAFAEALADASRREQRGST